MPAATDACRFELPREPERASARSASSSAVMALSGIPGDARHYGSEERVATDNPARLNFVHSGTAVDALMNPESRVIRIFCG